MPTFGEWRYEPSGDSDGERAGIDHFVIEVTGPNPNDWREIACPPSRDHALLIAAAPDMLEILKTIVTAWESIPENDLVNEEMNEDGMWHAARAAIAKATGK
jgi:hypothetical protein